MLGLNIVESHHYRTLYPHPAPLPPGLNAPIPDNCSFGYHAGGWGKPPVDESGKPLYGDVFGTLDSSFNAAVVQEEIDTTLWGEMESESEEEESDDEEEEDDDEDEGEGDEAAKAGLQTPVLDGAGVATPSGMSSVGLGQETPELLELRKKRIEAEMEGGETPSLYTVLPEKRGERVGAAMMGSTHTYDVRKGAAGGIEPGEFSAVRASGLCRLRLLAGRHSFNKGFWAKR